MIKIGICDDERASRKVVGELLRGYFRDKNMECQQTEYGSGKEFLVGGRDRYSVIRH